MSNIDKKEIDNFKKEMDEKLQSLSSDALSSEEKQSIVQDCIKKVDEFVLSLDAKEHKKDLLQLHTLKVAFFQALKSFQESLKTSREESVVDGEEIELLAETKGSKGSDFWEEYSPMIKGAVTGIGTVALLPIFGAIGTVSSLGLIVGGGIGAMLGKDN